ncbi:MAG: PUA domain-containing protein [Candidatus Ranarchaeia archaeon]
MATRIHKRMLRSREVRELIDNLPSEWRKYITKKDPVENWGLGGGRFIVVVRGIPRWFIAQIPGRNVGEVTPFLPVLSELINGHMTLPKVVVDMGAVPFVARGADVMSPGIVEIDPSLKKGMYAMVVDERNKKPLSIGILLHDAAEIMNTRKGKALETIHHVGDVIWKAISNK